MPPPTRFRPLSALLFFLLLPALTGIPFSAWAQATTPPAFCASPTLQLIDTADTKIAIEQATAADAGVQGCGISGKMRVIVRGNNVGDIAFAGKVNANNELTADSIANFELPLAGLTLAMNELILEQENNDYRITAKQPRIQIPAEWGGLGGGIPAAQITKEGLKFSGLFEMPDIRAGGFLLKLKGGIMPVAGGYEINASGELGIPNLPGVGGCAINAGVVLFAGPDGTRNIAIQGMDRATVSAINAAAVPSALPLPAQWIQPTAAEALKLREITAGLNCQNGIPIGTTGVVLIKLQGTISLRSNDQFVQVTVGLASRVKLGDVPVVSGEGSAKITTAPGFGLDLSAAISVLSYQAASAEVSISEAQGFRTKIELSPPLFYASLEIKAWAKDGAFFFTGSGRARVQVCAGCIWKKWFIKMPPFEIRSPDVGADFGSFQDGSWGIKGFISMASWQIGAFINNKGEIKFGNVSDKVLATPSLVAQIRAAQQTAKRMGISAAERPYPEYAFAPDGSLIVSARLPLPSGSTEPVEFLKQLRPSDAISPTDVITQADTIFSMASAGPLAVSLIAPDNTEITPANAGTLLTHKVTFSQSVTTDVDTGLLITNSNYFVDQAVPGNWQVKITGDTNTISYTVAVLNPPAPPLLADLSVDASNKAQSQVTWRVRSNALPTTITVFANNGPITQTLAYTDAANNRTTAVVPMFQGQAMYTDVLDSLAEVNGQLVTKTIDLSRLESGAYNIWVRLENPSNPPVEGYATAPLSLGVPEQSGASQSGKHRYSPEVRIAADGYDALAQLANAAPIGIDNAATLTTSWTTPITVTPEGDGLRITWKPHPSPDVDAYVLYVGTNPTTPTQVIDLDDVIYQAYDADGDLIGEPIGTATLDTVDPGLIYYIWIGAQDDQGAALQGQIKAISAGRIARSNTVMATVPTGDFNMSADAPAYAVDVIDANGDEVTATVTATLQIKASADLFYPVDVYANLKWSPSGIDADVNDDDPAVALMSPSANRTVQVVFRIEPSVDDGIYTIPVVAYSGAIQKVVNVVINVGEADYKVFVPVVIR